MITKSELIEYLKHTPENTNYNILHSGLYNGSNKEAVDEFIEVLSHGNLSLAALQPYLAKLYEDDKTISPEPLPPFSVGGSSDAVLYTEQTLTDAQKKQARENIDAAGDFVITATQDSSGDGITLDKTIAQIQEAISAGKTPVIRIVFAGMSMYLQLMTASGTTFIFGGVFSGELGGVLNLIFVGNSGVHYISKGLLSTNQNGELEQQTMAYPPVEDMQIATKKYVDDHAGGGTDMGITGAAVGQIAKITAVDASGVPTAWGPVDMPSGGSSDFVINATLDDDYNCTVDKTYAQIQEAVQAGKKPVVYLDQVGTTITMPLVASGGFFGFAGSIMVAPPMSTQYVVSIPRNNQVVFAMGYGLGLGGDDETLRQISMSKDPVQEMEIATKKYVDDKEFILQSTTPNSTKKFKITVDDNGNISAKEVTA